MGSDALLQQGIDVFGQVTKVDEVFGEACLDHETLRGIVIPEGLASMGPACRP
jgi:hypothetical protein